MHVAIVNIDELAAECTRRRKIDEARRKEEIRKNIPTSSGIGKALMADPAFKARVAIF